MVLSNSSKTAKARRPQRQLESQTRSADGRRPLSSRARSVVDRQPPLETTHHSPENGRGDDGIKKLLR